MLGGSWLLSDGTERRVWARGDGGKVIAFVYLDLAVGGRIFIGYLYTRFNREELWSLI
jgi:hypothetical protein